MRLLLDTHALVWWLADDPRLSRKAEAAVRDSENDILVSAVSAFEIAQKHRLGKMPSAERLALGFEQEILIEGFVSLPITSDDARLAGAIVHTHRDPFDRLLISQALRKDLILVSNERLFDDLGVARLW